MLPVTIASLVSAPHPERLLLCCFRGILPIMAYIYGEASAPPEWSTFSRLLVYERIGKSVDFLKVLYFSPGWFIARSVGAQSHALKLASLIFNDL